MSFLERDLQLYGFFIRNDKKNIKNKTLNKPRQYKRHIPLIDGKIPSELDYYYLQAGCGIPGARQHYLGKCTICGKYGEVNHAYHCVIHAGAW